MAELAEAVNRLIVEIQTGFGRMEAKLDSLAAGKNDQLDDISAGIVDLKSTVSSLRSAVAGATGVVDTEMVEGAKSYLERPSTKTMSDDDKIMNTIKFLEAMFPDRSDDQRWASFEAANKEVK